MRAVVLVFVIVVGAVATFLVASSPQSAQAAVSYGPEETALVGLINEYRVSQGLRPLLVSDAISKACDRHSSDMGAYRFVDHYSTGGSAWFDVGASPWDRMAASGYSYKTVKGENVAAGYRTAADVLAGWKNSPAHNAVMLEPKYTVVGVSLVRVEGSPFEYYWTADFGGYIDATAHPPGR